MPVLGTGLEGGHARKARRKIRRLTRALGMVRELDVTLHILDELARNESVPRTAVEDVRARVVAERESWRKVMLERLDGVNAEKLGRRLAAVGEALQSATDEPWRKALGARLLKRAKRLAASMDAAGQMYAPENLHQVRIAAKKLRYGLELAADSGLKQAAPHVRAIKRVQDMLGTLHDLQVLQGHVAAVQAEPKTARASARTALETLSRHLEDRCRHLHGRYVAVAPKLREVCTAIRKTLVPQLAHPARRQRTLKMTLPRAAAGRVAQGRH